MRVLLFVLQELLVLVIPLLQILLAPLTNESAFSLWMIILNVTTILVFINILNYFCYTTDIVLRSTSNHFCTDPTNGF